jgi:hypothetical protein
MAGGVWAADVYLSGLAAATGGKADDVYGWCGLCHCFTEFPHKCAGADRLADEEAA